MRNELRDEDGVLEAADLELEKFAGALWTVDRCRAGAKALCDER